METDKSKIGDLYRNAFKDFEQQPSPGLWDKISQHPGLKPAPSKGFWSPAKLIISAASVVTVVSIFLITGVFRQEKNSIPASGPVVSTQQNQAGKQINAQPVDVTKPGETGNIAENKDGGSPTSKDQPQKQNMLPKQLLTNLPVHTEKQASILPKTQPLNTATPKQEKSKPLATLNTGAEPGTTMESTTQQDQHKETNASPDGESVYDRVICRGESEMLAISGGESYAWSTGENMSTIKVNPIETTVYTVSVTDFHGVLTVKEFKVRVGECEPLSIPNAFTPNNDGLNDEFKVFGTDVHDFDMQIYSRTGQLLFETKDAGKGWDGYFKGKTAESGIYVYHIKYTNSLGKSYKLNGTLTLIR